MSSTSETQVTFRLPKKLVARLDSLARRMGLKRSELLREATAAYVDVQSAAFGSDRMDRVKHLLGSLESGIPDLAEHHSDYLKRVLTDGR